jgi:hypothetical protein
MKGTRYNQIVLPVRDFAMIAIEPARQDALRTSAATLRRTADNELPLELDQRILDLMERKESLAADEKAELMAWVGFTQQRSVDKLSAELALNRLMGAFPELASEA